MRSDLFHGPGSVETASRLRWFLPLMVAAVGGSVALVEQLSLQDNPSGSSYAVPAALLLTLMGVVLTWLLLNWMIHIVRETRNRYEAMVALHETSLDIIAQLDTSRLLEALLRRGAHLLGANVCSLFLYDSDTQVIRNVANYNSWRNWIGTTLKPGQGAIGQVILTGKPLIVNNYETWDKREIFDSVGPTMVMCVPLRWQEQIIGGIGVVSEPGARLFRDQDLWLLGLFADLASIALKNAELHTQIKQFSDELEVKVESRTEELSQAKEEIANRSEQLRLLLAKTMQAQEDERARIARELHDGVVQLVTATSYELRAAQVVAGAELKPAATQKITAALELLDEMEQEIRHAIRNLRPPSLDAGGLGPALQRYTNRFKKVSGIECHLSVVGNPQRLEIQTESSIFRLVEEALTNVATHAEATEVSVSLEYARTTLSVIIYDDGCGFDPSVWRQEISRRGDHIGLLSMKERAEGLGGSMEIESATGSGTRLVFRLPLQHGDTAWTPSVS